MLYTVGGLWDIPWDAVVRLMEAYRAALKKMKKGWDND
jgi:hypothetical protein